MSDRSETAMAEERFSVFCLGLTMKLKNMRGDLSLEQKRVIEETTPQWKWELFRHEITWLMRSSHLTQAEYSDVLMKAKILLDSEWWYEADYDDSSGFSPSDSGDGFLESIGDRIVALIDDHKDSSRILYDFIVHFYPASGDSILGALTEAVETFVSLRLDELFSVEIEDPDFANGLQHVWPLHIHIYPMKLDHLRYPTDPDNVYGEEWTSWASFLGATECPNCRGKTGEGEWADDGDAKRTEALEIPACNRCYAKAKGESGGKRDA